MPTLDEMIEAAKEPEDWYKDVLDEVTRNIQENISALLANRSLEMYITSRTYIERHKDRLVNYLSDQLQADVRMDIRHDQRDGTLVKVEVARKGYFAALTQSYWEK